MRPLRFMLSNFGDPDVVESWPSQPNAGLNGRSIPVLAGNTLGGTSAINGAQFSRPQAKVPPPHLPCYCDPPPIARCTSVTWHLQTQLDSVIDAPSAQSWAKSSKRMLYCLAVL